MKLEWLEKRATVAEAEAAHMVRDKWSGPVPVPFGFKNARWKELIAQMRDGDELWEFHSPAQTWANMCGRAGYALVRKGKIVGSIITLLN